MTEMLKKEFSRRSFLKGGGAMIVGFSLAGAGLAGKAEAAESPFASNGPFDLQAADTFIAIHADNTASVKSGRVELGQFSNMGLLMIAAEELDMDVAQLKYVRHDTNVTPDTGNTAGSSTISTVGPRIRMAAATARQALLGLAAAQLGVPASSLSVSKGVVSGGGKSVTYGALIGDKLLNVRMAAATVNPGVAPSKPVSSYKIVGVARLPQIDIPDKVTGRYTYVHNIRVPGMLHGRLVRPRGQGAFGDGTLAKIISVDESSIKNIAGARIVRRENFLGVVAPTEYAAIQAASQLKVKWADPPPISGSGNMYKQMRDFDSAGMAPARIQAQTGNVDKAFGSAAHTVSASYQYQYNGHMPIGPCCAIGHVTEDGALVMANTQNAYAVRIKVQALLGLPLNKIRVVYWEGASSFGNGPARYDSSQAAALMSQLAGAPVRLQYMRWDEHGWDNYGPAQLMDARGAVDAKGNIVAYEYTAFAIPGIAQNGDDPTRQQAGIPLNTPGLGSADTVNSGTQYDLPNRRVIGKSLPLLNNYFKTSSMRAPQAPQTVFASEQLIDELAHAAGMDPYLFRLQNISTTDQNRWRDALVGVAELANWKPRVAASNLSNDTVVRGRGIALGSYGGSQAGVVVDIEVNKKTGKIVVTHGYAAQVAGLTVSLEGAEAQMEENLIMGTSRTLYEEVAFNTARTTSLDWVTYPILRFKDHPTVKVKVVQRTDLAPTGSGEPPVVPLAAAIPNAFFDATGVRMRQAPMTPAKVRAVLRAAGK
jgi:nicotinate dehydrogenase subunit B